MIANKLFCVRVFFACRNYILKKLCSPQMIGNGSPFSSKNVHLLCLKMHVQNPKKAAKEGNPPGTVNKHWGEYYEPLVLLRGRILKSFQ